MLPRCVLRMSLVGEAATFSYQLTGPGISWESLNDVQRFSPVYAALCPRQEVLGSSAVLREEVKMSRTKQMGRQPFSTLLLARDVTELAIGGSASASPQR